MLADWHDPDFVDRVWDYVLANFPQIPRVDAARVKDEMRREFAGEMTYVRARQSTPESTGRAVLSLFNGRNATEVARKLGISRASVYRHLKQAGRSA